MKRYYAFVWFWLWSGVGVCIFALVMLEAKEQNKDTTYYCTPSEEHQQVMEQLKANEENRWFSDNLVDVNLDAITQRLEIVERACSQN